jgi:dephospho-CoA kinase
MTFRRIGIAGYMGAGKTTAARLLAKRMDAAIIDADQEAKSLLAADHEIRERLILEFGDSFAGKDGISFDVLGSIVFRSTEKLRRLSEIVHPRLVERLSGLLHAHGGRRIVLDAAVLPLWKIEPWLDMCLWICAPFDIRLERLKQTRSDLDIGSLRQRMRIQEECLPAPLCPPWRLINNDGNTEQLAGTLCIL